MYITAYAVFTIKLLITKTSLCIKISVFITIESTTNTILTPDSPTSKFVKSKEEKLNTYFSNVKVCKLLKI